ncbi:Uncharacterised protein r2_g1398 [Pycnogonum litorale]
MANLGIQAQSHIKSYELIINSLYLIKDIGNLSPGEQTSTLESYHKIVTYFAPKSVHYSHTARRQEYVKKLLEETFRLRQTFSSYVKVKRLVPDAPEPISSKHRKIDKNVLVQSRISRFNR